jgi:hypothetical protein
MAFTLPPLQLSGGAGGAAGPVDANSQVGTPVTVSNPWSSVKNYQNHTNGSSQSATSSADPTTTSGGQGSGMDMKTMLIIGAAAWYLLS